jgi:FMN phosphatase YigB (HAD superfamily)
MSLTLLLDLDNTLLSNNMDTFVPPYIKALSQHVSTFVDPTRLVRVLMAATNEMVKNLDPRRTLMEVFDAAFYPELGVEKAYLQPAIDEFYTEVFPTLKSLTQSRPEAQALVMEAFARNDQVGIATNPLFPLAAIQHRLTWAGLSPDDHPFSLVPSYSTFHFSKPEAAYFAEFLAQMGWPLGPVVVVGDDPQADILPARRLGLPGFWVVDGDAQSWPVDEPQPRKGNLSQLRKWLAQVQPREVQPEFTRRTALLAILRSTPAALNTLLFGLDEKSWYYQPGEDAWSLAEMCCHLRDVEKEINISRLEKITTEPNPFLEGIDSDSWAKSRGYQDQSGSQALNAFIETRLSLINLLADLPQEAWQRPARHAIFGPTDITEMVKIITDHDRLHVRDVHHLAHKLGEK